MKFILTMRTCRGIRRNMPGDPAKQAGGIMSWPPEAIQAHIGFMMSFNKELQAAGELVGAEGLPWPTEAKIVRADADGLPITDGVFPESKEFLIGYWIVDVASADRAGRR